MHKDADFVALLRILSLACERHSMRLLAWCLTHNHFHLVLWPTAMGMLRISCSGSPLATFGAIAGTREATTSACAIRLGLPL